MPERGSWSIVAEGSWSSEISEGPDKGEGGGREVIEALMLGGVDIGLEGGEVERRMLVRREAKKAALVLNPGIRSPTMLLRLYCSPTLCLCNLTLVESSLPVNRSGVIAEGGRGRGRSWVVVGLTWLLLLLAKGKR